MSYNENTSKNVRNIFSGFRNMSTFTSGFCPRSYDARNYPSLKRGNMLQLLIFIVHFMCLMKLPIHIHVSLIARFHLTLFHHGNDVHFPPGRLYNKLSD